MMNSVVRLMGAGVMVAVLAACGPGQGPQIASPGIQPPAEPANSASRDFGDYVLHFNAIRTNELPPESAKNYGIVRSPNRAMLNISIIRKVAGTPGTAVPGSVMAQAVNLNGQFKELTLRELRDGAAIYYIGDVDVSNDETLVFTIDATPINETSRFSVRFSHQFFADK